MAGLWALWVSTLWEKRRQQHPSSRAPPCHRGLLTFAPWRQPVHKSDKLAVYWWEKKWDFPQRAIRQGSGARIMQLTVGVSFYKGVHAESSPHPVHEYHSTKKIPTCKRSGEIFPIENKRRNKFLGIKAQRILQASGKWLLRIHNEFQRLLIH